jgi:hypothetical protein
MEGNPREGERELGAMKQKIKFISVVALLMFGLFGCRRSEDATARRIAELVKDEGSIVRIRDATDFEWDQFYIFEPYSNSQIIKKSIGDSFDQHKYLPSGYVEEKDCFFVFLKSNQVVRAFPLWRYRGDFSESGVGPYFWDTALFKVYYDGKDMYGHRLKVLRPEKQFP